MTLHAKIDLMRSVLDELATVGYMTNPRHKAQILEVIRGIVADYEPPLKPNKAETTMHGLKLLANIQNTDLNKLLAGLAALAEKALGELHLNLAHSIINN